MYIYCGSCHTPLCFHYMQVNSETYLLQNIRELNSHKIFNLLKM